MTRINNDDGEYNASLQPVLNQDILTFHDGESNSFEIILLIRRSERKQDRKLTCH